jgi:hypothetical protein
VYEVEGGEASGRKHYNCFVFYYIKRILLQNYTPQIMKIIDSIIVLFVANYVAKLMEEFVNHRISACIVFIYAKSIENTELV